MIITIIIIITIIMINVIIIRMIIIIKITIYVCPLIQNKRKRLSSGKKRKFQRQRIK